MVVDNREKILSFIKTKGPVLPFQIAKEINTDIIMASAHLAELTATHKAKISHIKVGGSPLYYLAGQEEMLHKFIGSLNDKEKKAFDLLLEKKVLREVEMEPVIRVSIREMKDFAHPLNVSHNATSEVFWKWHLATDSEAEQIIKQKLNVIEKKEERKDEMKEIRQTKLEARQDIKDVKQEKEKAKENQTELRQEKIEKKKSRPKQKQDDSFLQEVTKFFEKSDIIILSTEIIRKGAEIDFTIEIPSVIGGLRYYCKAKSKKKLSDADLGNVFVKSQAKKLPAIIISNGELSSKASEILGKELNIIFKRM